MPVRFTRQVIDIFGINLGSVVPRPLHTIYVPFIEPNWDNPMSVESSWAVSISKSPYTGKEERLAQSTRPFRVVSYTCSGLNKEASTQIQMSLFRYMQNESPIPLYTDFTISTRKLNINAIELECDTLNRRFFRGQRILIVPPLHTRATYGGIKAYGIYAEVKNIQTDRLILVDPLGYEIPIGSYIYPCIDCLPLVGNTSAIAITDTVHEIKIQAYEYIGSNTLPPTWLGEIGSLCDYYKGYPIFAYRANYGSTVNQNYVMPGQRHGSGIGMIVDLHDKFPRVSIEFEDLSVTRQEAWQTLQFFDSRKASVFPFWVLQPISTWSIVGLTQTQVIIEGYDYLATLNEFVQYIGFEDSNGKIYPKKITGTTETSNRFYIDFDDDPFIVVPSNIVRVAPLWLSRFSQDSITQSWETDTCSTSKLTTISLRGEGTVT